MDVRNFVIIALLALLALALLLNRRILRTNRRLLDSSAEPMPCVIDVPTILIRMRLESLGDQGLIMQSDATTLHYQARYAGEPVRGWHQLERVLVGEDALSIDISPVFESMAHNPPERTCSQSDATDF